jgi:hypothetical protein
MKTALNPLAQLQDAVSRAARAAHDLRLMTQPERDAQWSVRQTEDVMRFTQAVATGSPGEFDVEA